MERPAQTQASSRLPGPGDPEYPVLFLDVNLGNGGVSRIIMYEGDDAEEISAIFCEKHGKAQRGDGLAGLDEGKRVKLKHIIDDQMRCLLPRIEEENEI